MKRPSEERPRPMPEFAEELFETVDVSLNTEATYRFGLQAFAEFLLGESEELVAPVKALQEESLLEFRHWMRKRRGYNQRTEKTYLSAATRYLEWLDVRRRLPEGLSSARMRLLLEQSRGRRRVGYKTQPIKDAVPLVVGFYESQELPPVRGPRELNRRLEILRNRAITQVLFASAMRVSELCSLTRSSVEDGRAIRVRVTGKGEKERTVLLSEETQRALVAYLHARDEARPPKAGVDEPLFVRHDGGKSAAGIRRKTVWLLLQKASAAVAERDGVSPHDFRRYLATTMLSEGMPLESVQEFLGHESIVTTRTVYARTRNEVLEDQVTTYRPTAAEAAATAKRETTRGRR